MKYDLSILIPARNEMFLNKTIETILEKIQGKTELIIVCDGNWPAEPIEDLPDIQIIYHSEPIGQRGATNEAAKLSRSKFIMKADAHCLFDVGFDVKMMADCEYEWTVIPRMYNLHAFNWHCKQCDTETYQGPTAEKCEKCGNTTAFERHILWNQKARPTSDFFRFDSELHFQYWGDFKKRPEAQPDLAPTMSMLGACWMMHRERYWELDGLDEEHGSWGQMGTELACKSWLSGGALMVNKKTWFAHMFRTQGKDFGFPYPNNSVNQARRRSKELWLEGKWPKAKYSLKWLLDKFAPVPEWDLSKLKEVKNDNLYDEPRNRETEEKTTRRLEVERACFPPVITDSGIREEVPRVEQSNSELKKGIIYYTDNRLDVALMKKIQDNLLQSCNGHKIVSVSLQPIDFGSNVVVPLERSNLTMFKQILIGLEVIDADIIFFCEHDVLYSKEHFQFIPPTNDCYYYNTNTWQIRATDGFAVRWDCKKTSQLCAYRSLLLQQYRERVRRVEIEGFTRRMGFEPGSHNRTERIDDHKAVGWQTVIPNLDIRHKDNLTKSRWNPSQFRSIRSCKNWKESNINQIVGWESYAL